MVHWRREWQTTSAFLPWEPHEQYGEDLPYPPCNSRAWVVHPADSLWGPLPLTMVGLMAGCFGSQCMPLPSFPSLPLWEHMESSELSTRKLGRWCFPLARLVHSLYAAGPTPCWPRTPGPVDFSQATKWEARHAELYFQHPWLPGLANPPSPQVSRSNPGETAPVSRVPPPPASPVSHPLCLPPPPPQSTLTGLVLLLDGRSPCVKPLFSPDFISFCHMILLYNPNIISEP